jgi:hypothetical protein
VGEAERYRGWLEEWRHAEQPLAPFHWEIEFPEVFERENPGFDAFVGNPPFMSSTAAWSPAVQRWAGVSRMAQPSTTHESSTAEQ